MGRKPRKNQSPKTRGHPGHAMDTAGGLPNIASVGATGPRAEGVLTVAAVCGMLLLAVAVVFGQTVRHEFVNFDDDRYVVENPQITHGLTARTIGSAFTHSHAGNWHPLTSISHILDWQFYGLWAGGHHLTNVLLHGATAVLLLLVLRQMTGRLWPSAVVAALFAIHPLRVESVAWVAERKDVLSGLFFMLTLAAYVGYVRRPFSLGRYMLVVTVYALALMTKPMLVTLPFVLLLLDYWPLGRFSVSGSSATAGLSSPEQSRFRRIVRPLLEKVPLFGLAAASSLATFLIHRESAGLVENLPAYLRVPNVLVSYTAYLEQMFWPASLAVFYPFPSESIPAWQSIGALLLLIAITAGVVLWGRRRPYLLVGWLWYLATLVPVIGLVQVGAQARADRYTYLTQIGVYVALVWLIADVVSHWRRRRLACGAVAAGVLASLGWCASVQTSHWRNSEALWSHTLECTSRNWYAYNNLAVILQNRGELDRAMEYLQVALAANPQSVESLTNVGMILRHRGRLDEAIGYHRKALAIDPQFARAHNNLANALNQSGRLEEAIVHYEQAIEIAPQVAETQYNCGVALSQLGRLDDAIAHYRKAVELNPGFGPAREHLAIALYFRGHVSEAVAECHDLLRFYPNQIGALTLAAWALATSPDASIRNGAEAVALAQQAARLPEGQTPETLNTLAAAYAEAGRFPEAVEVARRALLLASARGNAPLADALRSRITLYQAGTPFRDIPPAAAAGASPNR